MKLIYTAIIGNYDTLKRPLVTLKGWEYVCYTDQDIKSDVWNIVKVKQGDSATETARMLKILPAPSATESLWVDGSLQITEDIISKIKFAQHDLILFRHPERINVWQEFEAVVKFNKDSALSTARQMEYYKLHHEFSGMGLPATGVIYRYLTPEMKGFCVSWWNEVKRYSMRDQLSFNFAAWKTKTKFTLLDFNIYSNPYFKFHRHNTAPKMILN